MAVPFGAVELGALGVSGPEARSPPESRPWRRWRTAARRSPRLRIRSCARAPNCHSPNTSCHRAGQPAQQVDLVDGLVDQRAAAFGLPASLNRPRIIFGRAVPLHVAVALEQLAQAAGGEGLGEEQAGVIEAVLADHAQQDAGARARSRSCGARFRDWSKSVSAPARACRSGRRSRPAPCGNPETCKRPRNPRRDGGTPLHMRARIPRRARPRTCAPAASWMIGAHRQLVSDVPVSPRVHVRNCARADHSDSHRDYDHSSDKRWRAAPLAGCQPAAD